MTSECWKAYVEAVYYECAFSAQYTANIQILFSIDDIVRRMPPDSFAIGFPAAKAAGTAYLIKAVDSWLERQDPSIKAFFVANPVARATAVIQQKGCTSITIDDKVQKLMASDEQVISAISMLRYPLIVMEKLQRGRAGSLLDLERDALFVAKLGDELDTEVTGLVRMHHLVGKKHNSNKL